MLRMELYVDEQRWKQIAEREPSKQTQVCLNTFITACEEQIVPCLLKWNETRTKVINGEKMANYNVYKIIADNDYIKAIKAKRSLIEWEPIADLNTEK